MPFSSSRRSLYRIVYPLHERPAFEMGRFVYEVIDCSERGIRYYVQDRHVPALGTPLGGTLQFRRGGEVEVTGEVIRTRAGTVALALDAPGISFSDILAEQRYLRARGYMLRD
jgi:PilZ domain-containing protein